VFFFSLKLLFYFYFLLSFTIHPSVNIFVLFVFYFFLNSFVEIKATRSVRSSSSSSSSSSMCARTCFYHQNVPW